MPRNKKPFVRDTLFGRQATPRPLPPAATGPGRSATNQGRKPGTPARGKMPLPGYRRTSLDLPENLYEEAKIAAIKSRLNLRDILEAGLRLWLDRNGPDVKR